MNNLAKEERALLVKALRHYRDTHPDAQTKEASSQFDVFLIDDLAERLIKAADTPAVQPGFRDIEIVANEPYGGFLGRTKLSFRVVGQTEVRKVDVRTSIAERFKAGKCYNVLDGSLG